MSYWGKVLGGMAGFAMGGPFGAVMGAALGHAADQGAAALPGFGFGGFMGGLPGGAPMHPVRIAAMFGQRDQIFALGVVALSAKLARCDGPVNRAEIDAFKRQFRVMPEQVHDVGRLFDQARDNPEDFEVYARQMGTSFSDNRGLLEEVLGGLFTIARADAPLNRSEQDFLTRIHRSFGLDQMSWDRAVQGAAARRRPVSGEPDPYTQLGVTRGASDEELRAAWKRLMRENHPDSLASRGVPPDLIARASEKVARINAAWDRIKRERSL